MDPERQRRSSRATNHSIRGASALQNRFPGASGKRRGSSGAKMEAVRTCLGCRIGADRSALLRVVARDGVAIPDPSATLPGRGAWVHPTSDCVDKAIARKAFGRALRVEGQFDTDPVKSWITIHTISETAD